MPKCVAVLEVMWDWRAQTSSAGYAARAPEYFRINGDNHTGKRLYDWLGHHDLLVTNACPELVTSARGRGKPDLVWLHKNISNLRPFELILVCGKVAQETYVRDTPHYAPSGERVVFVPHPAARMWSRQALARVKLHIREGTSNINCFFQSNQLKIMPLEYK